MDKFQARRSNASSSLKFYLLKYVFMEVIRRVHHTVKLCVKASFELLTYPYCRNRAKSPVRRSLHGTAKEGQSNKRCSVSSMPSFEGRKGFMVSLKLCLNFVKI